MVVVTVIHHQPGTSSRLYLAKLDDFLSFANAFVYSAGTKDNKDASNKSYPPSDVSSPPTQTPEIKAENGNLAVSPMLDALSSTSISGSTVPSVANDWGRGGLAGSPGNLISLMGESPPTQPSSYEDSGKLQQGWAGHRAFMTPSPASPSPPSSRRPLSYQMDSNFPAGTTPPQHTVAGGANRNSMHSPFVHSRLGSNPPLPHQPQAHFYGAPSADVPAASQAGLRAGDQSLYFGFDTLPRSHDIAAGTDNVVLAGYHGGLKIYSVSKKGLDLVGSIRDLRGGVYSAKILPWTLAAGDKSIFPLVAVVVHGPVLPLTDSDGRETGTTDGAASPRPALDGAHTSAGISSYQTSVEIYSLQTNQLVDVLLQSPKIPINTGVALTSPLFQPPPPAGALSIQADDSTIVVTSGTTGECWIYSQLVERQNDHFFACTGKVWTCLQRHLRGEVVEDQDKVNGTTPKTPIPHSPIVSLRGHWLAYCPAAPSSQVAMRAHIPVPILGRGAGISSMAPPHLPTPNSSVDLPISDSMINKIMRGTTQELIHGAKWVGKHGLQAWNSYWNSGDAQAQQPSQARSPPQQWTSSSAPPADTTTFPPTHGALGSVSSKDPGVVSIVDTAAVPSSSTIHPMTTFVTPGGCSFLSFSPSSLMLFTASSKGDVQTVWDLLRIQYTHSSPLQASVSPSANVGPQVRQVAQFSRMTVARIVDVSWAGPLGDQISMVTERGTIHLLELPFSATMWPPPRRRKITPQGASETSETPTSAVAMASGALGAAYQVAKPFVTRSRRASANTTEASGNAFKESAAQGGRVIAASISSSLGKTGTAINNLRHSGENRVSLPSGTSMPIGACVSWIMGKRLPVLFALGGGMVRKFPNRRHRASRPTSRFQRASRYKDMKVPLLPDDVVSPLIRKVLDGIPPEEYLDLSDADNDIGNTMTLHQPKPPAPVYHVDSTIPQAEIETSAPFQPFHTDRRVALCAYSCEAAVSTEPTTFQAVENEDVEEAAPVKKKNKKSKQGSGNTSNTKQASNTSAWAFGQDIPMSIIDLGIQADPDDNLDDLEHSRALPPSAMETLMQYGDEEQIVVTTRRRRGMKHGNVEESGFFEDDCEVLDFADQRV